MSDVALDSTTEDGDSPTPAGMYDYYLGGNSHSAADRAAAERVLEKVPETRDGAWANRGFLGRAVRWMAAEHGIRQFIDLGAGMPSQRPTHEAARKVAPDSRVVYTDSDPRVIARGREILAGIPGTAVIQADLRDPDALLSNPLTRELIDFDEPAGLLIVAVTQFVPDEDDPWNLVGRHVAALAPGSFLALSAVTGDKLDERKIDRAVEVYAGSVMPARTRTRAEIARFFTGLEIVPPFPGAAPDVTYVGLWGCEDPDVADTDGSRWFYAAVGRKP